MFKRLLILLAFVPLLSCTSADLQNALGTVLGDAGLTQEEIGKGLKEALTIGIREGAQKLAEENGYYKSPYKILLPEEAQKITNKLKSVPGFTKVEEVILEKINRGAEEAAKKAAPIFVDAITSMSFADATKILMGSDNAATQYLNARTHDKLYAEFNPVIVASLDKFNAREYWSDAVTAYNRLPLVEKMNPSLDDYVTQQALAGLFSMVEKKEIDIRHNVSARTTDLLKRVFSKQDNK